MEPLSKVRKCMILMLLLLCCAVSGMARSKALITQRPDNAKLVTLYGNVYPQAQAQFDQGKAPDSLPLKHMLLVLKRDTATETALEAAIAAQYNPKSPNYHKWMTPQQFRANYGVADEDSTAVANWLSSQGFSEIRLTDGGAVIEFSGTAAIVRNAFHTQIHTYMVEGESHWANATDPMIPAALEPAVFGVVSLHNFPRVSAHKDLGAYSFNKKTGKWSKTADTVVSAQTATTETAKQTGIQPNLTGATSDGNNYYAVGPGDFNKIYNVDAAWDAGYTGEGQEIAIVGRSAITESDVDAFRGAFGLPATKLRTIHATDDTLQHISDEGEALLDIQWSGAVAKNATINYVAAASTDTTDGIDLAALYAVEHNVAPVLSVSYGMCELGMGASGNAFYNELWRQAAAQGMTVVVATGDYGSTTCPPQRFYNVSYAYLGMSVSGLASTPYNVAVGGTDFNDFGGPNGITKSQHWSQSNDPTTRSSALSYIPEMVWNDSCANTEIYRALGFYDALTACHSDQAYNYNMVTVTGGGGGVSSCTDAPDYNPYNCEGGYDRPSWQNVAGIPDNGKRNLPDVSLFSGDGMVGSFYLYCMSSNTPNGVCDYDNPDTVVYMGAGGTSFAAPAMAGVMALINQKTGERQGNANYTLYSLARDQFGTVDQPKTSRLSACSSDLGELGDSSCIFHDVVTGDNAVPCDHDSLNCSLKNVNSGLGILTGYYATTGYDPASGLGSVNVANLVNGWSQIEPAAASQTTLSFTPTSSVYGNAYSYTVTVASTTGGTTPAGTVLVLADNVQLTTAELVNGTVTGTFNQISGGQHSVTARYVGNGDYAPSLSNTVDVTVAPAATTTELTIYEVNSHTGAKTPASTVHYGSQLVAGIKVNGLSGMAAPGGTAQLSGSSTTQSALALDGTALIALEMPTIGATGSVAASYSGDSNYLASTAAAQNYTVAKATTAVRLTSNVGYQVGDGMVSISATAYSSSTGEMPTGKLTLTVNGTPAGELDGTPVTDPISGGAAVTAVFQIPSSALTAGNNTFAVSYAGDTRYEASTSEVLSIGFGTTAPASAIVLAATPTSAATQQSVQLTATVRLGDLPATAGTVTFYDNGAAIGEVAIVRNTGKAGYAIGSANLSVRPAVGAHSFTAKFNGLNAIPAAVSEAAPVTVAGALSTKTTLTAVPNDLHSTGYDFTASVMGYGVLPLDSTVTLSETSTVGTLANFTITPEKVSAAYDDALGIDYDNYAEYLSVVDLNNDGIPDLAVRQIGSYYDVIRVRLGLGNATYGDPVDYPVGKSMSGSLIAAGDFNGDGAPDLATLNSNTNDISVLLGNGDGSLQTPYVMSTGQMYPAQLKALDVDHDGVVDLVSFSSSDSTVAFFRGKGDGTFEAPVVTTIPGSMDLPAFGDLNHDGNLDFIYRDNAEYPTLLHVAFGDGAGHFTASETSYSLTDENYPMALALADLNGDGNLDAISANSYLGNVLVLFGDGNGGFGAPAAYTGGKNAYVNTVLPIDADGDGHIDLAVIDTSNTVINILRNNGDGTFAAPTGFVKTTNYGSELYAADLNGDGVLDLLTTSQQNQATQVQAYLGGRKATLVARDVKPLGPEGLLQSGVAVYEGNANYTASISAPATFYGSGGLSTPQIVWTPQSASWSVNTPLTAAILNATTEGNVQGTFAYTAQLAGGSVVPVTASSSLTEKGSYTLTAVFTPLDATSYTTATASIAFTVSDPDFTVSAPDAGSNGLTLASGGSTTTKITVDSGNGFYGYVNLSCATAAPGLTCAFNTSSIVAGGSATLTVNAGAATPSGNVKVAHAAYAALAVGVMGTLLFFPVLPSKPRQRMLLALLGMTLVLALAFGCGDSSSVKATSLSLSTANSKVASGSAVTLTANLTAGGKTVPSGTVAFYDGTTQIGTGTVTNGVASFTTSSLVVGVHSLTAQFAGEAHNQASTSNTVSQVVTGKTSVTITAAFGSVTHTKSLDVNLQ